MKPDESYSKLQSELQLLIKKNDQTSQRTKLKKQLEKKFMNAWQFTPDRLRLGSRLCEAIEQFRKRDGKSVQGFDHCTFYTGADDQRIIVTQPYDASCSDFRRDLILDKGICPEIIEATEWAFYYPGRADLFIIKFPFGYAKALESFKRKIE
jgi:hypothetical protein